MKRLDIGINGLAKDSWVGLHPTFGAKELPLLAASSTTKSRIRTILTKVTD
jgi:hypothetical protein